MREEQGFIGTIILIILALAAAKYFLNWDVFEAASSDQGQSTIGYIRDIINTVWGYIGEPVAWIWRNIVTPLISFAWQSFQGLMDK